MIQTLDARDADNSKYALVFYMRGNPPERELKIYPDSLSESNAAFAEHISKYVTGKFEYVETEKELIDRLEIIRKILADKAKNPTGFWETFTGAFIDIFRT